MYRVHRVPIIHDIIPLYAYYMGMAMYRVHRCMFINNPYQIVVNKSFNIVLDIGWMFLKNICSWNRCSLYPNKVLNMLEFFVSFCLICFILFSLKSEAQSLLEPYKGALADIENQTNDQSEKIASVKRNILLNEEKISKLLFSIGKQN